MLDANEIKTQLLETWKPLGELVSFQILAEGLQTNFFASHQPDLPLQMGSCFKAFLVAECLRQAENGLIDLAQVVPLTAGSRVPDSAELDSVEDGTIFTLLQLLEAMIRSSDNTATELVLEQVGPANIKTLLEKMGLETARFPRSLRRYAELAMIPAAELTAEMRQEFEELTSASSASDLVRFYKQILEGKLFVKTSTLETFKAILQQEDLSQQTQWPADIVCYRKSGFLDLTPFYAMGLAGALEKGEQHFYFAFIGNFRQIDENQAATDLQTMAAGISQALKAIAALMTP